MKIMLFFIFGGGVEYLGGTDPSAPMAMLPAASYDVAFWHNIFFNYL